MQWRIESKTSGCGRQVDGTLDDAIREAQRECTTDASCWVVWMLPVNRRVAEVTLRGCQWRSYDCHRDGHMLGCTHPEWARMWESLCDLTGHYSDRNPQSGEFWQYMGTFWKDRPAIGSMLPLRVLVHQFRHRDRAKSCKPIPGLAKWCGRVILDLTTSVAYSGGWNDPLPEGTLVP